MDNREFPHVSLVKNTAVTVPCRVGRTAWIYKTGSYSLIYLFNLTVIPRESRKSVPVQFSVSMQIADDFHWNGEKVMVEVAALDFSCYARPKRKLQRSKTCALSYSQDNHSDVTHFSGRYLWWMIWNVEKQCRGYFCSTVQYILRFELSPLLVPTTEYSCIPSLPKYDQSSCWRKKKFASA